MWLKQQIVQRKKDFIYALNDKNQSFLRNSNINDLKLTLTGLVNDPRFWFET